MSIGERNFTWTLKAGEDLTDLTPGTGHLYKAIALDDGKIAQNGREAGGIILYGSSEGEHVTIGYAGVMKFTAGADIEKGQRLTVAKDGYFVPATPGTFIVGRCLDCPVKAGAISTGVFNFASCAQMMG